MMEEVAQSGKKQKFDIKELDTKNKKYMELVHKVLVGWDNLYDLGTGGMFEYDGLILDGTEDKPLVDLNQVHREKGITFRTEIHRRTIGNQQFEERYVLQISSKMLKERYFEGIDSSNIHLLYQYIIDLKD
jgi:hypothetical protein